MVWRIVHVVWKSLHLHFIFFFKMWTLVNFQPIFLLLSGCLPLFFTTFLVLPEHVNFLCRSSKRTKTWVLIQQRKTLWKMSQHDWFLLMGCKASTQTINTNIFCLRPEFFISWFTGFFFRFRVGGWKKIIKKLWNVNWSFSELFFSFFNISRKNSKTSNRQIN